LALFVQGEKAEITDQLKEVHQEIGKKERELQAQSNTIQNLSNKIQEQESMIKRILFLFLYKFNIIFLVLFCWSK